MTKEDAKETDEYAEGRPTSLTLQDVELKVVA